MRHLLRAVKRRQCFSTASAAAAAGDELPTSVGGRRGGGPQGEPLLPLRHSRKRLPPVCTDIVMLKEMTHEILQAREGSLFSYVTDEDSQADAWDAADSTCQKVDFLVRGHAARLPGTMWQRWVLPVEKNSDMIIDEADMDQVTETLSSMEALLDRIWDEGHSYMTVRADRMQEKAERNRIKAPEEEKIQQLESQLNDQAEDGETLQLTADEQEGLTQTMEEYEEMEQEAAKQEFQEQFGMSDFLANQVDRQDDEDEDDRPFMNDFALPGPTIDTFHAILDAMACNTSSPFVSVEQTRMFYNDIMARHYGM